MKTHDEIREAIEHRLASPEGTYDVRHWQEILYALNDRIEALEKRSEADFAVTHDRITSEIARANNIPWSP